MAPTAMVISDEERVAVDALIKSAVLEKAAFEGDGVRVQGFAWNYHKFDSKLGLYQSHEWTGPSVPSYLNFICPSKFGQPQIFSHHTPSRPSTTACIVYADDGHSGPNRQWLVAFDTLNNLVYVEAGPLREIDWQEVLEKLMSIESGPVSEYEDPIFHGKASAEIRQENGIYLLFVRFSN